MKSPINWYGGKYYMANKIIELFPNHKCYVEVFGGAGHILFRKKSSEIEVFNDIDKGLITFFKVLRDEKKANQLKTLLELTPYSREEFYNCRDTWETEQNEIERVRKWYTTVMQSFSSDLSSWSFSKSKSRRGMSQSVSQWLGKIEKNIPDAIERLRMVQIENLDFRELIIKYDSDETLFYLDPPYIHDTRKTKRGYQYEMTNKDHKELVNILLKIKGKAILSGYQHSIYDKLLQSGWYRKYLGSFNKCSAKVINTSRNKGEEFVWINYEI